MLSIFIVKAGTGRATLDLKLAGSLEQAKSILAELIRVEHKDLPQEIIDKQVNKVSHMSLSNNKNEMKLCIDDTWFSVEKNTELKCVTIETFYKGIRLSDITVSDYIHGVALSVDGYSNNTSEDGEIVLLDLFEDKPSVKVWDDINNEDRTHSIDLSGAKNSRRENEDPAFSIKPYWENTGGHCMVQLMQFTKHFSERMGLTGLGLIISNELVGVYSDIDDFYIGLSENEKEYLYPKEGDSEPSRDSNVKTPCLKEVQISDGESFDEQSTTIHLNSGYIIRLTSEKCTIEKDSLVLYTTELKN